MRKFVILAAMVSLFGGVAVAQDRDHRGSDRGNTENRGNAETGRNSIGQSQFREHHDAPSPSSSASPSDTMRGINRAFNGNPGRPDSDSRNNSVGGNNGRPDFNRPGPDRRDVRRPDDRRDFNNGRGRRDFSNYRNYHQNFRAAQRFRAPPYRRPPGYFARRWSWGQTLPVAFWSRDYWLTDFYAYDLPPPPYGAIWVRVGEDALLIDQYTGEIIEVDYGIFY